MITAKWDQNPPAPGRASARAACSGSFTAARVLSAALARLRNHRPRSPGRGSVGEPRERRGRRRGRRLGRRRVRADREGRPRRGERERVGGGAHGRASQMLPFDEQQVVVLSVPLGLLGLGGMVVMSGAVPDTPSRQMCGRVAFRRSCAARVGGRTCSTRTLLIGWTRCFAILGHPPRAPVSAGTDD